MSTLAVTRALISLTNPTEAQFDTYRSELLAYFNGTEMNENNIAAGGMLYTSLSKALDNAKLNFTGTVAFLNYVSASTVFQIENTLGAIVFSNTNASEAESLRLATTGKLTLGTGGLLKACQGQGSLAVDTMWLLANYRKPRLQYTSDDIITSAVNSPNADQTLLILRDRLGVMVDRTMSLAATANGYDAADVGAAVSGIRDGLARATNTWYYIYGVQVQYGSDSNGSNCIMVADTTSPVQGNCATLDTRFGAGKWVYLGVIRNGYNDGTNTNIIVPFTYDGYGNLRFTTTTETGTGQGVRLAAAAASTDLTYTVAFGTGATDLPVVCTRGTFVGHRSSDGFQVDYVNISSGEIQAQGTCCADTDTTNSIPSAVHLTVPLIDGYRVVVRVGSDSTTNRIYIASLVDHYA